MTISNISIHYDQLQPTDKGVVDRIDSTVRQQFAQWEAETLAKGGTPHKPNEETLSALKEVSATMVLMATGAATKASIYLSSLNAGDGKSTTMNKALPEIAKHYPDAGILVCLSTIEEVLRFANEVREGVRIYGSASEDVIVDDDPPDRPPSS